RGQRRIWTPSPATSLPKRQCPDREPSAEGPIVSLPPARTYLQPATTGGAEASSCRCCSRGSAVERDGSGRIRPISSPPAWIPSSLPAPLRADQPSTAMGGADRRTSSLPHISRLLSTRLSRGSVGGGDGRGGSGDLFPSRTDPIVSSRRRRQEGRKRQPPHCCQFRPLPHRRCLLSLPYRKIGYGTASEALACKLPFIFVRRDYFNEEPFLRILLEHYQSSIEMTRREFLNGYWKLYLLRALTLEPCYDGPTNGGEAWRLKLPRILEAVWACGLVDVWKVYVLPLAYWII
uniref:Uncharacterized protein n=1 Tax=Oryza glaberrima TaxID=4538 RepID=I1P9B5_ORYGL